MLTPEQAVRFQRQIRLPQIGAAGQACLARARAAVVGCGGLGSLLSQIMVRMGVGRITAIDGDRPELSNLHRQLLSDESDVADGRPKAHASVDTARRLNFTLTHRSIPPAQRIETPPLISTSSDVN